MNLRTTGILFVVAAALGAYIYIVEIRGAEEREAGETAERRLFAFEADAVQRIELPLGSGGRARIVRAGDGWRLEAPIVTPADASVVDRLVDQLVELEARSTFEEADELEVFGLGDDRLRVEIWTGEGDLAVLAVGKETPVGSEVYALVEGNGKKVHTIEAYKKTSLSPELRGLRDKSILDLESDAITSLAVRQAADVIVAVERSPGEVEEGADPEWRITSPVEDAGDPRRVRRFLQDLGLARASAFVDQPGELAAYGLDPPEVEVDLAQGDERRTLAFGQVDEKVYARRDGAGVVWELPRRTLDQIPRESFAFRAKTVLEQDPGEVAQLELHFPRWEKSYSFVRDDESWKPADEELELDPTLVDDLLFTLDGLEATRLEEVEVDREALGLDPPLVRVVQIDSQGAELAWLELGDPEPGAGLPAMSSQTGERVWRVINDLGETVPLGAEAFENRWSEAPAEEELPENLE